MQTQFNTSIWGDEGFSAILSMKTLPEIISTIAKDTSPPLWNISEWAVFQLFGTSEVVIRGLAFFYFLVAIFFTYKITSYVFSKKSAIYASLLIFTNPFFFIYAFEGRMYSILAAMVTASMYFFLKRRFYLYVIFTTLALYTHHFAIFALFVQGVWFLVEFFSGKKSVSISMFKSFVAVGLLYSPWIVPLYNQTKMVGGGFWLGKPDINSFTNLINEYLAVGNRSLDITIPLINIKIYQLSLYLVITTLIIRNWFKVVGKSIFLIAWFMGPIIVTYLISQKFQSIFFNRYLLYTIPAAMILVASNRRGKISNCLIIIIVMLFSITDIHYFTHPKKLPFREMSEYVTSARREGDFLVNWNSSAHHLWETKYYGMPAPIYIPSGGELPYYVGTALMEKSDIIREIPKKSMRVGVVTSGPIEEVFIANYTEVETKIIGNLKFIWYQKNKSDNK